MSSNLIARLQKHMPTPKFAPFGDWETERAAKVEITPHLAEALLTYSKRRNRHRSDARVHRIITTITEGRWRCNGQTIVFDRNGGILDGHTRLMACVQAGVTIETWIVLGIDPEFFETYDVNAESRTRAQVLDIMGYENYNNLSAAATVVHQYDLGTRSIGILKPESDDTIRQVEIASEYADMGLKDSCSFSASANKIFRGLTPKVMTACHFLFGRIDPAARDVFFAGLAEGAGLESGSPVLATRNALIRMRSEMGPKGSSEEVFEKLHMMFKAWNATRKGTSYKTIKLPTKEVGGRKFLDDLPDLI